MNPPFVAFTICARNFIPYARALHRSLMRYHPDSVFVMALCDLDTGFDHAEVPFEILTLPALRDTRVWGMAERYNITEFCTAIKPAVFQVLMDRHPGGAIVYFDPDIWVTGPLLELELALESGAQAVLTPHITEPGRRPDIAPDQIMLRFGAYNLGFLALREGPATRGLLAWWAQRLEHDCRIDLPAGLFVDQKWADLFPALLDRVVVLRHPGYNVAYWNAMNRPVRPTAEGWMVHDRPLRFVHFSGHDLARPDLFSRHLPALDRADLRALFLLQAEWREAVVACGFWRYGRLRYGFRFADDLGNNTHTPVELIEAIASGIASFDQAPVPWPEVLEPVAASALSSTETGRCGMCRTDTQFVTDGEMLLRCRCGFDAPVRAAVQALTGLLDLPSDAALCLADPAPDLLAWLRSRWPNTTGADAWPTGCDQFDAVLSVGGLTSGGGMAACWRGLKPGGMLVMAAERDPPSGAGRVPGAARVGQLQAAGFVDARYELVRSARLGLDGQGILVAQKPADAPRQGPAVAPAKPLAPAGPTRADEWAYGSYDPGWPILHAYHLEPAITAVMARLATFGALSLVDRFRMIVLLRLLRSTARVPGEVWELGVYQGGTALLMRNELAPDGTVTLRLFDTFAGLPDPDPARDFHVAGEFGDASLAGAQALVGQDAFIDWRPGIVPATFTGLDGAVLRFVHIDLDLYAPIVAAIAFTWPRLAQGGVMLFDDYGFWSCPGARTAVDEFCAAEGVALVPLPSGQALVVKLGGKCLAV